MNLRIIAIDWSGAVSGARKKIWLAEAVGGELLRLENGRDRDAIASHLVRERDWGDRLVVGLDFAFGLPAWYPRLHSLSTAPALWDLAVREGEAWLARCDPPFWGRPGKRCPEPDDPDRHFRRTDLDVPTVKGIRPKSVFQIGGAGAVGTGSLRGMGLLAVLASHGFSVWPFDAGWPRVVEIYPRALTGQVVKSDPAQRYAFLDAKYPDLPDAIREIAASNEDAFDAAVSALVMAAHAPDLERLERSTDPNVLLEGWMWYPSDPAGQRIQGAERRRPPASGETATVEADDDPMELARQLLDEVGVSRFKALMRSFLRKAR